MLDARPAAMFRTPGFSMDEEPLPDLPPFKPFDDDDEIVW